MLEVQSVTVKPTEVRLGHGIECQIKVHKKPDTYINYHEEISLDIRGDIFKVMNSTVSLGANLFLPYKLTN